MDSPRRIRGSLLPGCRRLLRHGPPSTASDLWKSAPRVSGDRLRVPVAPASAPKPSAPPSATRGWASAKPWSPFGTCRACRAARAGTCRATTVRTSTTGATHAAASSAIACSDTTEWQCAAGGKKLWGWSGYGSIPIDTFLVGWTSIYQLFWGSLGTRVLTHPHLEDGTRESLKHHENPLWKMIVFSENHGHFGRSSLSWSLGLGSVTPMKHHKSSAFYVIKALQRSNWMWFQLDWAHTDDESSVLISMGAIPLGWQFLDGISMLWHWIFCMFPWSILTNQY